jgi:hypothetical protein
MENIERDITMSINMNDDKNIPTDTEAYYEAVASQEEIYLEEVEEELRAILIFGDPSPSRKEVKKSMSDANNDPRIAESLDEQLHQAAEDLITADPDDPPLSEEAIVEMLEMTVNAQRREPRCSVSWRRQ